VKLTIHRLLVPRSRKCGSIHLFPHTPLVSRAVSVHDFFRGLPGGRTAVGLGARGCSTELGPPASWGGASRPYSPLRCAKTLRSLRRNFALLFWNQTCNKTSSSVNLRRGALLAQRRMVKILGKSVLGLRKTTKWRITRFPADIRIQYFPIGR
jgi:hypothetical protein